MSLEKMATADHKMKSPAPTAVAIRLIIAFLVLLLLVYMCLQTDHARAKGTAMDSWRLIPLLLSATLAAFLGKRFINSISGLFLGGIGGAIGTLDQFSGPYGGIVGLLVGAIIALLPAMHKPTMTNNSGTKTIKQKPASPNRDITNG